MKLISTLYVPQESVNDDYLSLMNVYVKTGDFVTKDTLLADIETSKAVVDVYAAEEGYVVVHVEPNTDVKVGSRMFEVFDSPITDAQPANVEVGVQAALVEATNGSAEVFAEAKFSKQALAYIERNSIDRKKFNGLAFVTTKDIIERADAKTAPPAANNKTAAQPAQKPAEGIKQSNLSDKVLKPLPASKKREFEYLSSVNSSSVISRLSVAVQISDKENVGLAQTFIKSTPLPTVIQEVSKLLIKYPNLNSFYFDGKQAFYNDVNIGFALDDGKNGLKVATIFKADVLSLKLIEEAIADLSLKYTNQQLTVPELTSANFTITDLYNTNIISFHPLVNINNSCILGISGFRNGEFVIDLSFDHRLTNGKEVSLFLGDLKFRLETRFHRETKQAALEEAEHVQCVKCLRDTSDDLDGSLFFHKVVNSKYNGYICSNCLNGW